MDPECVLDPEMGSPLPGSVDKQHDPVPGQLGQGDLTQLRIHFESRGIISASSQEDSISGLLETCGDIADLLMFVQYRYMHNYKPGSGREGEYIRVTCHLSQNGMSLVGQGWVAHFHTSKLRTESGHDFHMHNVPVSKIINIKTIWEFLLLISCAMSSGNRYRLREKTDIHQRPCHVK